METQLPAQSAPIRLNTNQTMKMQERVKKSFLEMAAAGAAVGTAVGAIFGHVGAAIGGVIGAIVGGLFGSSE
jgi:uncharacterized membrane protein